MMSMKVRNHFNRSYLLSPRFIISQVETLFRHQKIVAGIKPERPSLQPRNNDLVHLPAPTLSVTSADATPAAVMASGLHFPVG
jgi:hypothetical protein